MEHPDSRPTGWPEDPDPEVLGSTRMSRTPANGPGAPLRRQSQSHVSEGVGRPLAPPVRPAIGHVATPTPIASAATATTAPMGDAHTRNTHPDDERHCDGADLSARHPATRPWRSRGPNRPVRGAASTMVAVARGLKGTRGLKNCAHGQRGECRRIPGRSFRTSSPGIFRLNRRPLWGSSSGRIRLKAADASGSPGVIEMTARRRAGAHRLGRTDRTDGAGRTRCGVNQRPRPAAVTGRTDCRHRAN